MQRGKGQQAEGRKWRSRFACKISQIFEKMSVKYSCKTQRRSWLGGSPRSHVEASSHSTNLCYHRQIDTAVDAHTRLGQRFVHLLNQAE